MPKLTPIFLSFFIIVLIFTAKTVQAQIPETILDEYLENLRLLGSQNYEEFIIRNKELIKRYPQFCRLYQKQAFAYNQSNNTERGKDFFLQLIQADSTNPMPYYGLGLIYDNQQEYEQTIEYLKKSINFSPQCSKVYLKLLDSYVNSNKIENALQYFEHLVAKDATNYYLNYVLGYCYQDKFDKNKSAHYLNKCLEINPDFWQAYVALSRLEFFKGSFKDSFEHLGKARAIVKTSTNDPEIVALIFARMGAVTSQMGLLEQSQGYLKQALNEFRKVGNRLEIGVNLSNLGNILQYQGNYKEAILNFERAILEFENVNDQSGIGIALGNIGLAYKSMGYSKKALNYYQDALSVAESIGDLNSKCLHLCNLGEIWQILGNYSEALKFYFTSLNLAQKLKNNWLEAINLEAIGDTYKELGNFSKSLEYLNLCLEKYQASEDKRKEAACLSLIGSVYQLRKDYRPALQLYQKALQKLIKIGEPIIQINCLNRIGQIYSFGGESQTALIHFSKALELSRNTNNHPGSALTLLNFGECNINLHKLPLAISNFKEALDIVTKHHYPEVEWQAHWGIAKALERQNRIDNAIEHYKTSLAILDSMRITIVENPFYTDFLKYKASVYISLMQLLAKQQRLQEAFLVAQDLKSDAFFDKSDKTSVNLIESIPESLKVSILDLENKLEQKHKVLSEELSKGDSLRDVNKLITFEGEITSLESEKKALWNKIKEANNDYYQLVRHEPRSIRQIQNDFLEDQQAIVEYIVGMNKTSVFIITQNDFSYHEIEVIRDSLLNAFQAISPKFRLNTSPKDDADIYFNAREMGFSVTALYSLFQTIFKPIEPYLEDVKELIVIPDDFLNYIPFEMLISDTSGIVSDYDFSKSKYLLHDFAISYAPSAGSLAQKRPNRQQQKHQLIAFGNPKFDKSKKERLGDMKYDPGLLALVRGDSLLPLPHAEDEVKRIADILNVDKKSIFIGSGAQETIVKSTIEDSQIIHFATHHLLNDWEPLYSKMILAQADNGQEDGFLHTYEIFNLHLNADLVVLSACNTGLGRIKRGEGLTSLARAFLYAGAQSLVASLWSVNDVSTSNIMQFFYRNLKNGMKKNMALQQAKIQYINSVGAEKADPFYWAPFILIGDLKTIEFVKDSNSIISSFYKNFPVPIILALFAFAVCLLIFHKKLNDSSSR